MWKYPTRQSTGMSQMGISCFLILIFQSHLIFTSWKPVFTLLLRIMLKPWTLYVQERYNQCENRIAVKSSRRMQKIDFYLTNGKSGLAIFITDLENIFRRNVGNEFGKMLRGTGHHIHEFA